VATDATVNAAVEKLAGAGVKAHGQVAHAIYGYAAREIVSFAREDGIGVIVMGSRGHGDLAGLLVGSTAHKVIHLADRPVLVVREVGRARRDGGEGRLALARTGGPDW
jgi:nucleotide-binding universal stress UspA family protein